MNVNYVIAELVYHSADSNPIIQIVAAEHFGTTNEIEDRILKMPPGYYIALPIFHNKQKAHGSNDTSPDNETGENNPPDASGQGVAGLHQTGIEGIEGPGTEGSTTKEGSDKKDIEADKKGSDKKSVKSHSHKPYEKG